jgi:hypothetical protein
MLPPEIQRDTGYRILMLERYSDVVKCLQFANGDQSVGHSDPVDELPGRRGGVNRT